MKKATLTGWPNCLGWSLVPACSQVTHPAFADVQVDVWVRHEEVTTRTPVRTPTVTNEQGTLHGRAGEGERVIVAIHTYGVPTEELFGVQVGHGHDAGRSDRARGVIFKGTVDIEP